MVIVKGIHLKKGTSDIKNLWRLLIADLMRQPEWKFLADKIHQFSPDAFERTFKEAVKTIRKEVCAKMGWAEKGGTTGNLSGEEGDMDELTLQVRQLMMDEERKREEKESGKALREELNQNEMQVLTAKIQSAAKRKRGEGKDDGGGAKASSPGSVSTLSAASPLTELQALDQYLATGRVPKTPLSVVN
jgi:hypothetical protein